MNNTIKLAVASALLAAASSASAAGGIVAGDWTLDIGGVVNAYYTSTKFSGSGAGSGPLGLGAGSGASVSNITTGLLPNYLSVSGKTRQNDLDVGFTISINPGASTTDSGKQSAQQENRQAFLTFGDASWGSMKLGKDLGIYASDAILNDMTLLGVGSAAGSLAGNTTTLGRIGTGFMYADWKSQIAYTSPNFNGFQFTAGVTQAWNAQSQLGGASSSDRGGNNPAFEGKASYAFSGGDVSGKVWASAISQKVKNVGKKAAVAAIPGQTIDATFTSDSDTYYGNAFIPGIPGSAAVTGVNRTVTAFDIGANVNMAGFGLTGYYGDGNGMGQTLQLSGGFDANGNKRDSKQYYVQGTYALPGVGTKLGVSYGESKLDGNSGVDTFSSVTDSMWVAGVYHPITKHLNLVAEYSESERDINDAAGGSNTDAQAKAKTVSLGAILFF